MVSIFPSAGAPNLALKKVFSHGVNDDREHNGFGYFCKRPLVSLSQRHRLRPCPGKATCKNQELTKKMPEINISRMHPGLLLRR